MLAILVGAASPADLNGTLTVMLGPLTATRQGEISDSRWGLSDLYPQTSLRWNNGVNSWMVYGAGDIPVGTYDANRLANVGIGHGAIDGGVGYTYFDPMAGHEFSVVTGLTDNFINPSTDYQNGIDWHVDWGASQFVTKTVQIGAVGYFYQQTHGRSGGGANSGREPVADRGHWTANRFHFSGRGAARLFQFQGLWRIRRREPGGWLERLGDSGFLPEGRAAADDQAADAY